MGLRLVFIAIAVPCVLYLYYIYKENANLKELNRNLEIKIEDMQRAHKKTIDALQGSHKLKSKLRDDLDKVKRDVVKHKDENISSGLRSAVDDVSKRLWGSTSANTK